MNETRRRTAVMFVGGMDDARVEGTLTQRGYEVVRPVDPSLIPHEGIDLVVLDPGAFGLEATRAVAAIGAMLPEAPLVALTGPTTRADLVALIAIPSLAAVVARDHVRGDEELDHAVALLADGPRFGIADRGAADAPRFEAGLAKSLDREAVLDQLRDFFHGQGVRGRLVGFLVDATEELITNAVYDAPTDAEGARMYASIDRRHTVFLNALARPTVQAVIDGGDAVVSVSDPHGSLEIDAIRRFLTKGLDSGPDQVDDKRGGAGLGIARVFTMTDQLTVQVERGVRTEVTLSLNLRGARRDMAARPTGLLLISV